MVAGRVPSSEKVFQALIWVKLPSFVKILVVSSIMQGAITPFISASLDICRLAHVGVDNSYSHVLQVFEGDIPSTTTDLPHWPSDLPPVDGVILCYDSSSLESFRPIAGLLSKFNSS